MTVTSPLEWPAGWQRTRPDRRDYGALFNRDFGLACIKLMDELRRMKARQVVLSTDVCIRGNRLPTDPNPGPSDPGAAIYFEVDGKQFAMACDRYSCVAVNVRSLGLAIEAMRQLHRHGGGAMVQRAFSGFVALPAPKSCWEILGIRPGASPDEIESAWRTKAKENHPDRGGSHDAMATLNHAREEALRR